jgi:hypothetical protein
MATVCLKLSKTTVAAPPRCIYSVFSPFEDALTVRWSRLRVFLAIRGPLLAMLTPLKVMLCGGLVCGIPSLTVGAPKGLDIRTLIAFRGLLRTMLNP